MSEQIKFNTQALVAESELPMRSTLSVLTTRPKKRALKIVAARLGLSTSDVVRMAIDYYMEENQPDFLEIHEAFVEEERNVR
jgi:hypothetical protein